MSRSSATEIIALLWLIASRLSKGWMALAFSLFFLENTIESAYYAFKDKK